MKQILAAGLLLATLGSPSWAELLECTITKSNADFVPKQLVILRDDKTGKIVVNDPVINHFNKKPVEAKIGTENNQRLTILWSLTTDLTNSVHGKVDFTYRATYLKNSKKIIVRAQPRRYSNEFEGRGTCTLRKAS